MFAVTAAPLVIETFGLSRRFGVTRAVESLSLAVPAGSIFGLLGPAGAGKTTTLAMLRGRLRPSAGGGRVLGHDIVYERAALRRSVGAVDTAPAFYNLLSAGANLRLLARPRPVSDSRVGELLQLAGLTVQAGRAVRSFSLGMRRRLALAAALLGRPALLLVDEPTTGLDPAEGALIGRLLVELHAAGHTIVIASRELAGMAQLCTDVAIMQSGRLLTAGPARTLLVDRAALLVEAEPLPLITAVAERMGLAVAPVGPRTVAVQATPEQAPRLVAALVHAGASVFGVTPQRQTLEERFLALAEPPQSRAPQRCW